MAPVIIRAEGIILPHWEITPQHLASRFDGTRRHPPVIVHKGFWRFAWPRLI